MYENVRAGRSGWVGGWGHTFIEAVGGSIGGSWGRGENPRRGITLKYKYIKYLLKSGPHIFLFVLVIFFFLQKETSSIILMKIDFIFQ